MTRPYAVVQQYKAGVHDAGREDFSVSATTLEQHSTKREAPLGVRWREGGGLDVVASVAPPLLLARASHGVTSFVALTLNIM